MLQAVLIITAGSHNFRANILRDRPYAFLLGNNVRASKCCQNVSREGIGKYVHAQIFNARIWIKLTTSSARALQFNLHTKTFNCVVHCKAYKCILIAENNVAQQHKLVTITCKMPITSLQQIILRRVQGVT